MADKIYGFKEDKSKVEIYSANDIDTKVGEIVVPTKVSELENDSGFITSESVPTKVSELENDSGYALASEVNTKVENLCKTHITTHTIECDTMGSPTGKYKDFSVTYNVDYVPISVSVNPNAVTKENAGVTVQSIILTSSSKNSAKGKIYYRGNSSDNVANIGTATFYVVWLKIS